jgi:hypothetical protein
MDVERLIKLGEEYFSEYFRAFLTTIRSPTIEFQPVKVLIEDSMISQEPRSQTRLSPQLCRFIVLSFIIGSVLNSEVSGRTAGREFVRPMIIVIVCWLLWSCLIHFVCWMLAGHGSFMQTVSVSLRVLAVIYVLSSLFAFLWGVVVKAIPIDYSLNYFQGQLANKIIHEPIYSYFLVQFFLLLIYLPLATIPLHSFRFSRHRKIPKDALSIGLFVLEPILFCVVFLVIALAIMGLSKTSYDAYGIPMSQPSVDSFLLDYDVAIARIERENQRLRIALEEQSRLLNELTRRRVRDGNMLRKLDWKFSVVTTNLTDIDGVGGSAIPKDEKNASDADESPPEPTPGQARVNSLVSSKVEVPEKRTGENQQKSILSGGLNAESRQRYVGVGCMQ